ncbi:MULTISPECIES: rhodanese-like domain-containing protein [unclassified Diaminobutyricimonas]|uniref:rhodanese-like domain-containing protein n=1 Tax=unclassified Diaminobutyricimonas TaxID=2643261 RepID=UPI0012F51915|nr:MULTISPECIES: rhodanese-like domain-containing protein [unclassified Diaminobutyricimonas]
MNEITVTDLAALGSAATIVDVREQSEFDEVHVDAVTFIPMSQIESRIEELPHDETLYVLCRSGARSARVAAYLEHNGYDAVNVAGGIMEWEASGLPVVRS